MNTSLFYAQTIRKAIEERVEILLNNEFDNDNEIQQEGEILAIELGRVLETKMRVINVVERLRRLQ